MTVPSEVTTTTVPSNTSTTLGEDTMTVRVYFSTRREDLRRHPVHPQDCRQWAPPR